MNINDVKKAIVGKTFSEGTAICEKHGFKLRVSIRDGVSEEGTCDMRGDRLNVKLTNGSIESTIGIG